MIVNSASVGSYFYDGEGKRVKKVVGGETTVFVYSAGKLVAEYSTTPPPEIGQINYTTTDHLGSPRIITNAVGQVQSRRDFMPFGEEMQPTVGNRSANSEYTAGDEVRQKFTGYQKDEETKLDFAEARMYENRHARFTAVDPLLASGKSANPQSFNRYIYVGNNPLLPVDRNGLIWGKSEDGRVRWFGKKLGTGFSEFRPENWEYIGKNNKIIRLDPNSRKFTERDVPLTPGAVDNPIRSFLGGFRQSTYDAGTGTLKGFGNLGIGIANLVTDGATGGIWRSMAGYDNPFEIERFKYNSTAEYNFGVGSEVGITVGSIVVGGVFTGKPVSLSVVPESSAAKLPTLVIDYNKYPQLAENVAHAQKAGHPEILTWQGNSAANRAEALRGVPRGILSRDEYPFASTVEGGSGSWVGHIPQSQNSAQGLMIRNFRSANNLQPGDKFVVCVINVPGC